MDKILDNFENWAGRIINLGVTYVPPILKKNLCLTVTSITHSVLSGSS